MKSTLFYYVSTLKVIFSCFAIFQEVGGGGGGHCTGKTTRAGQLHLLIFIVMI